MARPGDVVAESAGPYYSQHTRIVMHTGQPTVVGWDWHLKQRGQPMAEISARFEDLESLYSGGSRVERRAILDRYRVRWVVLADLERQRYGLTGRDVLNGIAGLITIAEHEGAALFMVRDLRSASEPIAPALELPRGVSVIAEIPETSHEIVRSIDLDAAGAVVALRDGQISELDLGGRPSGTVPPPPCELSAVTRWREVHWSICSDGRLFRRGGGGWQLAGRLEGADRISSGTTLWAWGDGGLWQYGDRAWQPFFSGRVTAAAVNADWIAFSDGTTVLLGREGVPTTVAGPLDGVRSLAWQGTSLVAADNAGLHRSGGAMLPWRTMLPEVGTIVAVAGQDRSLWMVRSDGLVIESTDSRCPPAWEVEPGPTGKALREPRDLAVSPEGWFVVADTQNHRVRWYSATGACLDEFGIEGTGIGEFNEPSGLALAPDGSLAVTDTWNGRVQLLRSNGEVITVGSNLFGPRDALWTPDGSLLVADTGNSRLLRYDPPDWREAEVATFPGPVVGLASVLGAIAAAVPADGAVFVVDLATGETVRRLEVPGWSGREQQESYLAVLPSGYLAATAPKTGEVWAVDPSGQEPAYRLRGGLPGITGIALHPDGHLAAALTWEHRLEKVALQE
jgi:sugar lactone lactonase YvrE